MIDGGKLDPNHPKPQTTKSNQYQYHYHLSFSHPPITDHRSIGSMAKDLPKEATKDYQESKHYPSDRKREKKEKKAKKKKGSKKSKESRIISRRHDSRDLPSNEITTISQVEVELERVSASLNNPMSEGCSWGAAFAAASKIQPTDLGEQFINPTTMTTTTEDQEGHHGVAHISHVAHEYTTRKKVCSNDNVPMKVTSAALERKQKRKNPEPDSNVSDNDDDEIDSSTGESVQLKDQDIPKQSGLDFPYPTNPDDHCETPRQSYLHILPLLNKLSNSVAGGKHSMRIYDPYYCDGSVVKHLSSLGFTSVYNKKEDCYAAWKSNVPSQYDVLITNPPYSEDHIEKLMNYVTSPSFGNKPWLLLMPQWVHKKDYYLNAISKQRTYDGSKATTKGNPQNPFYIVPRKRYVYLPPANFREKKDSDVHKKSSPFVSMWYCWGGNDDTNEVWMNEFRKGSSRDECDLARSKNALRDLRRSSSSSSGGKNSKKQKTGKY